MFDTMASPWSLRDLSICSSARKMLEFLKLFTIRLRCFKIIFELYFLHNFNFQPVSLVSCLLEVSSAGKIPSGRTEIPFEFPLRARSSKPLYETYHGVFVSIQYTLKCEIKRSFLAKDLVKTAEFFVEYNVSF